MPWNPPVTSNLPATKVTVTIFDEIAENQVYLKERADVVDSDLGQPVNTTDDVTFNSVTTPTGAITTLTSTTVNASSIPTVNSTTINNSGTINPTTTPTSGTWTSANSGSPIPRGLYNVRLIGGASNAKILQNGTTIMEETSFGGDTEQLGGAVFADGVNTTLLITGTSSILYWKF